MSGLFSFVNVLADAKGPGTVGIHDDPGHAVQSFLLTSGKLSFYNHSNMSCSIVDSGSVW